MVVQYTVQKYIHYIYNYSSNSTLVELSQIGIYVIVGIISFKTVKQRTHALYTHFMTKLNSYQLII